MRAVSPLGHLLSRLNEGQGNLKGRLEPFREGFYVCQTISMVDIPDFSPCLAFRLHLSLTRSSY